MRVAKRAAKLRSLAPRCRRLAAKATQRTIAHIHAPHRAPLAAHQLAMVAAIAFSLRTLFESSRPNDAEACTLARPGVLVLPPSAHLYLAPCTVHWEA